MAVDTHALSLQSFEPTRAAADARLAAFLPFAGKHYERHRNYDQADPTVVNVSGLSPYLRHRIMTEEEVLRAVLDAHGLKASEKFVQEVVWRTYWKGWLQMRPSVWSDYTQQVAQDHERLADDAELASRYHQALQGTTQIDCFDDWAGQLVTTGYLHNHARMWFASIWIFTLKLPWSLGADFFLHHLLDGDPASNTLSWRWVAGLQTRGKAYQATAENIERFTQGRYRPHGLAEDVVPLDGPVAPSPKPLVPRPNLDEAMTVPSVCIAHCEDIAMAQVMRDHPQCQQLVWWHPFKDGFASTKVATFKQAAVDQARLPDEPVITDLTVDALETLKSSVNAYQVVMAEPTVGPLASSMSSLADESACQLVHIGRDYDATLWPLATKGFFPFKERALKPPSLIETIV